MKSKICFVYTGNLYTCPYLEVYLDLINCEYDIIYWDRDNVKERTNANKTYVYNLPSSKRMSNLHKIKGYLGFRSFAKKILKTNAYDGVVLLQTTGGVLLKDVLRKYYKDKYILDIRDYTMEKNRLFYWYEKGLIYNSYFTVISSQGYKEFLPPYDYVQLHNNRGLDDKVVSEIRNKKKIKKDQIVIAYIGYAHYQEQYKKLITLLKNDDRFELHFIGKEAEKLLPFCQEINAKNVKIKGQFSPDKILEYYKDTDIINNLYGSNVPLLDYALSNKLYFAAQLGMPILVCEGTYMEKISKEYGFGYTFDLEDGSQADKLYEFYNNIDWEKFQDKCDVFCTKVEEENSDFKIKVTKFFTKETNYD